MTNIVSLQAIDLRFPTSQFLDGSDAMNPDPDYSAAYVILKTDTPGLSGFGLTFTIGRGNDIVCKAVEVIGQKLIGTRLEDLTANMHETWRMMAGDSQIRWLGPEKGVVHLAVSALINAVWDLYARREGKPLWQLIYDMSPEAVVQCVDFRHISDALSPNEALDILNRASEGKAARLEQLRTQGYPAYTTSAGWLGYDDDKIRALCREAVTAGWRHIKIKVGRDIEDDRRRAAIIREELGPDGKLMFDANQVWDVDQAITWVNALQEFSPWWIEEPTSPDDILGHARIAQAVHPIGVATGEHCHNRVMWKQFMQAGAVQFCQIDGCRLGGLNEVLAVMLMAAKFDLPVCPHAGGVGLCEYVQHFSMIDFLCISTRWDDRLTEHASHLHEHFVTPIQMQQGRYLPPTAAGFSVEIKQDTLSRYSFPDGPEWHAAS